MKSNLNRTEIVMSSSSSGEIAFIYIEKCDNPSFERCLANLLKTGVLLPQSVVEAIDLSYKGNHKDWIYFKDNYVFQLKDVRETCNSLIQLGFQVTLSQSLESDTFWIRLTDHDNRASRELYSHLKLRFYQKVLRVFGF